MNDANVIARISHYVAMDKDIIFPTAKKKILSQIGKVKVRMGWDKIQTVEEIISPLKVTEYNSLAQFYNAMIAQIYK